MGRSAEGERGGCSKVPAQTGGETATEGRAGEKEEGEGSGEDRRCKGRVKVTQDTIIRPKLQLKKHMNAIVHVELHIAQSSNMVLI